MAKTVEELELAISNYIEKHNLNSLQSFVGCCDKLEPFGEPDLGKIINNGQFDKLDSMLTRLSTFSEVNFDANSIMSNVFKKCNERKGLSTFLTLCRKAIDILDDETKRKEYSKYAPKGFEDVWNSFCSKFNNKLNMNPGGKK